MMKFTIKGIIDTYLIDTCKFIFLSIKSTIYPIINRTLTISDRRLFNLLWMYINRFMVSGWISNTAVVQSVIYLSNSSICLFAFELLINMA
jgi:hypothetical protein